MKKDRQLDPRDRIVDINPKELDGVDVTKLLQKGASAREVMAAAIKRAVMNRSTISIGNVAENHDTTIILPLLTRSSLSNEE